MGEIMKRKIGEWKVKKNNKIEFDVWNDKLKLGYYAELKIDMDSPTLNGYWIVRQYSNEPFSAVNLAIFNYKEDAINFILNKIGAKNEE
jgi:hypothetical protein